MADFDLSLDEVRRLASESGLALASVTSSEPFAGLHQMLEGHIAAGRLDGLEWFDNARASVAVDPMNLHSRGESIISLGLPYYSGPSEKPVDVPRGRIARYAWGVDYHRVFRARLRRFHELLNDRLGRPVEARLLSDTARIVDRAVAVRSGLGWYGKHSCVIVPGHGSWVMLADAIVDVVIERSKFHSITIAGAVRDVSIRVRPEQLWPPTLSTPRAASHFKPSNNAERFPGSSDRF